MLNQASQAGESELLYRTLFDSTSVGIVLTFLDGGILTCNRSFCLISGYTEDELRRSNIIQVYADPQDRPRLIAQLREQGGIRDYETRFKRKDGAEIYVSMNVTPLTLGGEETLLSILTDITAYKRTEDDLRRSERLFQAVFNQSFQFVGVLDPQGRILSANQAALAFVEQEKNAVLGKPFWETPWWRHSQEEQNRLRQAVQEAARGRFVRYETTHPRPTGELVCFDFSLKPVFDDNGKVVNLLAEGRDISVRKRMEESLRESQRRLADIIDFLPDATFAIDRQGQVIAWNRAIEEMTGVAKEQILGQGNCMYAVPFYGEPRPILIDLVFQERKEIEQKYDYVQRRGQTLIAETRNARPYGGRGAYLWIIAAPFLDSDGNIVGAIESLRDITEHKRAEQERAALQEQLYQAQKMEAIGQLSSGIAHDFNNLLMVIMANIWSLKKLRCGSEQGQEALEVIERASQEAAGITQSLLTFSRQLPAEKKPVLLNEIINTSLRMLRRLLPATIELTEDLAAEPPLWISGDQIQLQQVIMNLALNARDAMPTGGKLRITAGPAADEAAGPPAAEPASRPAFVQVAVSDTGVGIPAENRPRIFEPFFTTKPRGQGTGLGLAVALGIVQNHGGRIEVASEIGRGTTFTILLPCISDESSAEQLAHEQAEMRGRGELVLLAEDHPYICQIITTALEADGYRVLAAADGLTLKTYFAEHADDLVLLIIDDDLPKLSGLDSLSDFRSRGCTQPAVLITGPDGPDLGKPVDGQTVLMRKPFQMSELVALIGRLLHEQDHKERRA